MEQAPIFVPFTPKTPIWETKDLVAGQRVILASQTSRIWLINLQPALLLLCLGKAFFPSLSVGCSEPRWLLKARGQSNQETTGDGRQERAPNKTRFKAAALLLSQSGERQERRGGEEDGGENREGETKGNDSQRGLVKRNESGKKRREGERLIVNMRRRRWCSSAPPPTHRLLRRV